MHSTDQYDVAIIGGGLAGLSCAIDLSRQHVRVIMFEKETYPFHKVCGEYISMESYDYLLSLGVQLDSWRVPMIRKLLLSSPSGSYLKHSLPLGGFGVSRNKIDMRLAQLARDAGVEIRENTRVDEVRKLGDGFFIETSAGNIHSRLVCAAYGKRSNLDIRWKRAFASSKPGPLGNFIGVKYHALIERPGDLIELHNFHDGYCGVSPIEDGKSCICYLTTAQNLKDHGSISSMQEHVLFRNPFLHDIFRSAKMLYDKPLTISQVSFRKKEKVENGIIFIGDSASMIAPLCGNGMSMALQSSRIASSLMLRYLEGKITIATLSDEYEKQWNLRFRQRMATGRIIQRIFGREWLSDAVISVARKFPALLTTIIRRTHG